MQESYKKACRNEKVISELLTIYKNEVNWTIVGWDGIKGNYFIKFYNQKTKSFKGVEELATILTLKAAQHDRAQQCKKTTKKKI